MGGYSCNVLVFLLNSLQNTEDAMQQQNNFLIHIQDSQDNGQRQQ